MKTQYIKPLPALVNEDAEQMQNGIINQEALLKITLKKVKQARNMQ